MFEIKIFPGDPDRGPLHEGHMFSLRLSDGSYYKSKRGYPSPESAAMQAGIYAVKAEEDIACRA